MRVLSPTSGALAQGPGRAFGFEGQWGLIAGGHMIRGNRGLIAGGHMIRGNRGFTLKGSTKIFLPQNLMHTDQGQKQ